MKSFASLTGLLVVLLYLNSVTAVPLPQDPTPEAVGVESAAVTADFLAATQEVGTAIGDPVVAAQLGDISNRCDGINDAFTIDNTKYDSTTCQTMAAQFAIAVGADEAFFIKAAAEAGLESSADKTMLLKAFKLVQTNCNKAVAAYETACPSEVATTKSEQAGVNTDENIAEQKESQKMK